MRAHEFITEHRLVFKRNAKTGSISMKWRCESGPRKGRTVPDVGHCSAAPDLKKSAKMKQTRQRTKVAQARKTKKTKRVNPMTKTATRLNKLMKKGLREDLSLIEIGYADELSDLSISDADVIQQSSVDGQIARRDVMKMESGDSTLYFFSTGNNIDALILLNNDRLVAMKNFTNNKGLIYGLFNYLINIKQQKLIIEPNDQLTLYGIDWILKQITRQDGFKIVDLAGDPIDPVTLKKEWDKSRTDPDRNPGPTGIIIGESAFGKRLRENETALMTYDIFGVNRKNLAEVEMDTAITKDIASDIKTQLGLERFDIFEYDDYIKLDTIIVGKENRGKGLGTKAMQMLTDYADSVQKRIILTPGVKDLYQGTTSRARLVRFYKQFGFKESKGRNIDYALGAGKMYRDPKGI